MRPRVVGLVMFFGLLASTQGAGAASVGPSLVGAPSAGALTVSFSNLSLTGFQLANITGITAGTLTSVSVNARLDASIADTYADDLMVYVDLLPLSDSGLLQIGGYSDLLASEHHSWANGHSSAAGTSLVDTVALVHGISFAGTGADPVVYLGNGYGDPQTAGTWTGTVTLNFTPAVPEPSTWLLSLVGVAAVAVGARKRSSAKSRTA